MKEQQLEQAYERTGRLRSPASAREVERVLSEAPGMASPWSRPAVRCSGRCSGAWGSSWSSCGMSRHRSAALRVRLFGHDRERERDEEGSGDGILGHARSTTPWERSGVTSTQEQAVDHQEDELLIALHEAQMVLSEAAGRSRSCARRCSSCATRCANSRATRTAPLPSWGLVVVVGLGALLLGLVVGVVWSTWDLEARITQALAASLRQQVQPPQPPVHPHGGVIARSHSTRTLLVHHQVPFSPEGPARFGAWLRRRGRDPLLGTSSQHGGSYRAAAQLAISVHVTGRTNPRPITCTEIDVQEPEKCWVRLNKCTETQ